MFSLADSNFCYVSFFMNMGPGDLMKNRLENIDCTCTSALSSNGDLPVLVLQVILSTCIMWFFCYILTVAGALPESEGVYGYEARTDIRLDVIQEVAWVRFPYPGKTLGHAVVIDILTTHLSGLLKWCYKSQYHLGQSEGWLFCFLLTTLTCNVWRNMLSHICRSIK